jgi:hypothetical protein
VCFVRCYLTLVCRGSGKHMKLFRPVCFGNLPGVCVCRSTFAVWLTGRRWLLLVNGFCNDAVSSSDCTMSNGKMINEL